jgi:PAS domain S-box-containing protein
MEYSLAELLDVPKLQALMDSLDELYSIPSAIIDMEGNILTGTSWQDICTRFHRANPESEKECIKSDTHIVSELSKGKTQVVYKCPQGLVDTATPIVVDGKHLGNAFTGQFFLNPPDVEHFRKLAKKYGFDEKDYIEAMKKVPVITEDKHKKNLKVLASLTEILAEQGLKQKRQIEIEQALRESRETFKALVEFTNAIHWELDLATNEFTYISPQIMQILGYSPERWATFELWAETIHPEDREYAINYCLKETHKGEDHAFVYRVIAADGRIVWLHDIVKVVSKENKPIKLIGVMLDISKQKIIENDLGDFRNTLDNTFDCVFMFEPDTFKFTYVNKGAVKQVGYSNNELFNMTPLDIKPEFTISTFREMVEPLMKGIKSHHTFETIHRHKNGNDIPVEIVLQFVGSTYLKGKFIAIVRDITERKQAEEALKISEEFLKKAQEIGHIGSWHLDIGKNILTWSDEEYRIFGHTPQSFGATYEAFLEAVHPDDREMVNKTYTVAITNKTPYECIHRVLRPDGDIRTVLERSEDIVDESGKTIHSMGMTLDITELKEVEAKLAISERKFRELAEFLPEALFEADTRGMVTYANNKAFEITGYSPEDLNAGLDCIGMVIPEDRERATSNFQKSLQGKRIGGTEYTMAKKDGSLFPVMIITSCIIEDGKSIGIRGVISDISRNKKYEKQILNSLKEKEILLKEVHHRVKNNMAVISSLLGLQAEYIDDKKYLDMFNESNSRIRSMALVHEKLYKSEDFSHIDVRDYIETLAQSIKSTFAGDADISSMIEVEDVQLDIDVLIPCGLIINEILTNAYKYAFNNHESPEINISIFKADKENVQISISDNGKGFPEGFDLSKSRGLGLKLVNILVKQINGKFDVKSTQGVAFTITFPAEIEHARHLPDNG